MKLKFNFTLPLLLLALTFFVGSAYGENVKEKQFKSDVEVAQITKIESKEAYKLDDAEYKTAVPTKFCVTAESSAFLLIAFTLSAFFQKIKRALFSDVVQLGLFATAIAMYFVLDADQALAFAAVPLANQIKGLKEQKASKVKEMDALIATSETEKRDFKPEEQTKYDALKAEVEGFNARIARLDEAHKRELQEAAEAGTRISPTGERPEISEKEERDFSKFSLLKIVRSQSPNLGFSDKLDGLELEMHQEAQREARNAGTEVKGVGVPLIVMKRWGNPEKRDMTAGTAADGGYFVQTDVSNDVIPPLRAKLVTAQAGAIMLGNLVGNVDLPVNGGVSVGWASTENATAAESTPTISRRQLIPKRLTGFSDVSVRLIKQTSWSVEQMLRNDYFNAMAVALDAAAINGSGSSGQPTGILNTSGIGDVAGGTNGLAPTNVHITKLEEEVAIDNADLGSLHYLTNPKVRRQLKNTAIETGDSLRVWSIYDQEQPLNGYKTLVTNNVPSTLTKGSSSGVCSAILFGNFNDLIIGTWGGMDVMANPYTKAKEGQVEIIAAVYADVAVRRAQSFAAMLDALTA